MAFTHRKIVLESKPLPVHHPHPDEGCQGRGGTQPVDLGLPCPNPTPKPHVLSSPLAVLAFILVGLLLGFVSLCLGRNIFRRLGDSHETSSVAPIYNTDGDDEDSVNDNDRGGDSSYNPVWLINTVGLQQPVIDSIAACVYRRGEGLLDDEVTADCAVCLAEFEDGETLRLLPKCNHAFHLPCIDAWLRSHQNCPLCRAPVVIVPADQPCHNSSDNVAGAGEEENMQTGHFENGIGVAENIHNPIHQTPRNVDCVESPAGVVVQEEAAVLMRRSVSLDLNLRNEEKARSGSSSFLPFNYSSRL